MILSITNKTSGHSEIDKSADQIYVVNSMSQFSLYSLKNKFYARITLFVI